MSNSQYERKSETGNIFGGWTGRLFLISINLFLLYFFLYLQPILYVAIGTIVLPSIIILFKWIRSKTRKPERTTSDDILDLPKLIGKYIKINKKIILATVVGLIIAVAMFSHLILVQSNVKTQTIEDITANGTKPAIQIDQRLRDTYSYEDYRENKPNYEDIMTTAIQEVDLTPKDYRTYNHTSFEYTLEKQIGGSDREYSQRISTTPISRNLFTLLQRYPTFDNNINYKQNMTLLVSSRYYRNTEGGQTEYQNINLNFSYTQLDRDSRQHISLNTTQHIDYYWEPTPEDLEFDAGLSISLYEYTGALYLPSESKMFDIRTTDTRIINELFVESSDLLNRDASEISQDLENARRKIESRVGNVQGIEYSTVFTPLGDDLRFLQESTAALTFLLLILSGPMIAVALYLVYFSLNLVEKRKEDLLSIMKVRGISQFQLSTILFVESIIVAGIATILGMLVSIPLVSYYLFEVGIIENLSEFTIENSWYWRVPLISLVLTIDLTFWSIRRLASVSIEETQSSIGEGEPFWRRYYIDVLLFFGSVTYWIGVLLIDIPFYIKNFLIGGFGPLMLILLLFGIPLLIARYFSGFISWLATIFWRREGNFIALSMQNLSKNKFTAAKLAVLLIMALIVGSMAIAVPYSYNSWNVEQAYYSTGADIQITNVNLNSPAQMSIFDNENITGYSGFKYLETGNQFNSEVPEYILAIDPSTYFKYAHWNDRYSDYSKAEIVKMLDNGKTLVDTNSREVYDIDDGDTYKINQGIQGNEVEIEGTFEYFPTLRTSEKEPQWGNEDEPKYFVMSLSKFDSLEIKNTTSGVFVDVKDEVETDSVANSISESNENFVVNSAPLSKGDQPFTIKLFFTLFEIIIFLTAIIAIIAIGYYSFITLSERTKEIGIFRAVGMVSNQIFRLLMIEILILTVFSMILGSIAGYFVTYVFLQIFQLGAANDIPPIEILFDPLLGGLFLSALLIGSIISAVIPSKIMAQKETGSILRVEE